MIDRACISLGERCNIHCKYCHFEQRLSKEHQEFDSCEIISIVDNIRQYMDSNQIEKFKIGIVGAGEPMLEFAVIKALVEHIRNVGEKRIFFYTISNSILVNKNILEYFFENRSIIALNYSYDGPEKIHNHGREKHAKVYTRILEYENLFSYKPPINCTIHRLSIENSNELLQHFEAMNFPVVTFSRIVDTNDPKLAISKTEFDGFLELARRYKIVIRQHMPGNEKKIDCTMYGNICGVGRTNIFFTRLGVFPSGRFYGNTKFKLGEFYDKIDSIQMNMNAIVPVEAGTCYFDYHNIGGQL
ncbi:MAG TPA: radical SAM protein [Flavobacterium sp.]|nr:radical SAM protein [Flavobacterium sp.]